MEKDLKAVILAAGKGTRMKSSLPKVMHEIFNKPLVARVLDSVIEAGARENIVITGHKREIVDEYLAKNYPSTVSVFQKEQLGTGHAIKCASEKIQNFKGNILILCGDTPLITSKSIQNIVKFHNENNADITVVSAFFDEPFGYGRIVRDNENTTKCGLKKHSSSKRNTS